MATTAADGHADRAEAAFLVADALQGRGIGTRLLEDVRIRIAPRRSLAATRRVRY